MPPGVPGVGLPHFAASDVVLLYVGGLWPFQVQKLVDATVFDDVTPERNVTSPSAPGGGAAATDIPLALVTSVPATPEPDVPGRTGKSACVSKRSDAPSASGDRWERNVATALGQSLVSKFSRSHRGHRTLRHCPAQPIAPHSIIQYRLRQQSRISLARHPGYKLPLPR